jgi:multidrug efflux pump subunit AcrA (membrane-fusion protein)
VWTTAPALTGPFAAVSRISGQFFVYVAEPANGGLVAHQKPVTLGTLVNNEYVIAGGLKAGDKVIVAGLQKIGEGAPVAPGPPGGGRGAAPGGPGQKPAGEGGKPAEQKEPARAGGS